MPQPWIGGRSRHAVEHAYEELTDQVTRTDARTPYADGALAAYRWALGAGGSGPITGTPGAAPPDVERLTAEVDASVVQTEDRTQSAAGHAFAEGVHDVLTWVCGLRDGAP
ncbi:protein of unknown function (plasmid) [Streptantibioticus cattleyicolor NRRL 8057 = DSM 46488]|nr:protein of unknown function [Streptantibioticus cattleyicolor NRRL 8057 = DSM 46488]